MSMTTGLGSVVATRYVTPLREGGSLPGLVEADDDGLYVAKFRGAGQGLRALVAEVIAGELARRLGLLVPELVDRDRPGARGGRTGPGDPGADHRQRRIQSGRRLPAGRAAYTPAGAGRLIHSSRRHRVARRADDERRPHPANPNLLVWHGRLWLIDHGAALYLHHQGCIPPSTPSARFR